MQFQNIIFDLDGTLIDSFPGIEQAYQVALHQVLPERTVPDIKNLIGPPIDKIFALSLQLDNEVILAGLVREFKMAYDTICWKNTVVYDGVRVVLEQLKNKQYNLFIVTNKRQAPSLKILNHFDLADYFTEIISPDSYQSNFTVKKETLSFLMHKYQMPAKKTIFVGDSEDDREAAASNNIDFVAAVYGYGKANTNQVYSIKNPEQLLTLIFKN
ncbi:HAD family hydrolase [Adhaeribacter radiodurans]|uniref:phosphoglycolate phosphatase n=1 Tax=Adhaeribacter radiodurans TaxID=2745197 RepID=A0A7L7L7Z2_9BACT|nr:HAD family hydrolase [Adhaeribacter radiodurans]QMU28961.1 HAD family hydrolase [Adhaeribacter radiodurans]